MKTFYQSLKTIVALLVCTICFSVNSPTAKAQFNPVMSETPAWSVEFLGKVYDRPTDDLGIPLVTNTVTNEVLFTSDDAVDLNGGTGAEVSFNFNGTRTATPLEIRSFIADFEESASVSGTNLFSPLFPNIAPDNVFTDYQSEIFSIEINAKRSVLPGLTFLAGPRFISLREEFTNSFDQTLVTPVPFTVLGSQTTRTRNSMYGLQLGFEFDIPIGRAMHVEGFGRFAGFANPVQVITTTTENVTNTTTSNELNQTTGTFVAEIGGKVYTEIVPGRLNAFLGYEATWIDGVALGPAQVLTPGATTIDTENTPFWNAIIFGFGYNF